MPRSFSISVIDNKTNERTKVSGILDDTECDLFERFEGYAEDLFTTKLAQGGAQSSLNIRYSQEDGLAFSTELPPWDDVIVFLHRFRPILLQGEPTHFNRICNLLERRLENAQLRASLSAWRSMYSGKQLQSYFKISSNDEILNSEKVLQDWLNAYEFHRDQDKKKLIDDLHAGFPLEASKVLFMGMLRDKLTAVAGLAAIIRVIMGRQDRITIK